MRKSIMKLSIITTSLFISSNLYAEKFSLSHLEVKQQENVISEENVIKLVKKLEDKIKKLENRVFRLENPTMEILSKKEEPKTFDIKKIKEKSKTDIVREGSERIFRNLSNGTIPNNIWETRKEIVYLGENKGSVNIKLSNEPIIDNSREAGMRNVIYSGSRILKNGKEILKLEPQISPRGSLSIKRISNEVIFLNKYDRLEFQIKQRTNISKNKSSKTIFEIFSENKDNINLFQITK